MAKLLEDKMRMMKEIVEVVNDNNSLCQNPSLDLPQPDYLSIVRHQNDKNDYTKEQLLSAVQVSSIAHI